MLGVGLGELGVRPRTVSILVMERGTVRGAARAAAGAYDRESCWMDSIVRTCHTRRWRRHGCLVEATPTLSAATAGRLLRPCSRAPTGGLRAISAPLWGPATHRAAVFRATKGMLGQ